METPGTPVPLIEYYLLLARYLDNGDTKMIEKLSLS